MRCDARDAMRCAARDAMRRQMRCELVAVAGEGGAMLLTMVFLKQRFYRA
jgi:hypothetical protein